MSEFPKPDVASGGIRLDGDRMQALVVGLASGRRDKTTQGTCSTSARVRTPCAMTAAPGPELDHRVPWGQDCRPVRLHAHGPGAWPRYPGGRVLPAPRARSGFAKTCPVPKDYPFPIRMRWPWDDEPCLVPRLRGRFCQPALKRKRPAVRRRNGWALDWVGEPLRIGPVSCPVRAKLAALL